jgi:hypothetical protein
MLIDPMALWLRHPYPIYINNIISQRKIRRSNCPNIVFVWYIFQHHFQNAMVKFDGNLILISLQLAKMKLA